MLCESQLPGGGLKETHDVPEAKEATKPGRVVRKLRDADAMLSSGKYLAAVLQTLEVSEATLWRWRAQHGGMMAFPRFMYQPR